MPKVLLSVDEIMAILPTSVPRIVELTSGLTAAQLHAPPAADEWSISDILAHLRACQDVLGTNMLRILTEDVPSWRAMNPRTYMRTTDYPEWEFTRALDDLSAKRVALLAILEPLPRTDWDRIAKVSVPPNKIFDYSVRYYGSWLAAHERTHLKHIQRTTRQQGR